jgi:anthranilate synthase component II
MKVLIIDNYDSFVYNLAQYVGALGAEPRVVRSDRISLDEVARLRPDRIVMSPGPGTPADRRYFGICEDVLKTVSRTVPTLGVCLGNQGIGHAFGASIVRAPRIMHGKTSRIAHDGLGIFRNVENPLVATRYHSLVVDRDTVPDELKVTATSLDDGEVMGVRHREHPIEGVQFHPESILTLPGMKMIANFLGRVDG